MDQAKAGNGHGKSDQLLDVEVIAPRDPEHPKEFEFNKHLTVGEAANEAGSLFGYTSGNLTFAKNREALDRSKQLVAAGVRDGDHLDLVDVGGGV
jgi:hypothetical protein